ncbi:MAG: hypothetical protein JXA04_04655 [Gammaproteobacteria bacterium]|nr:hypothetical protein [Gammaproteobacteria bacterium]
MKHVLFVAVLCLFTTVSVNASEAVDAVWKKQEVKFSYLSTEVAYSCDLMESRVKMLLRHLGAAEDVKVSMPPCAGFDRPQNRFRITADFSTLVPASESDTDAVNAEWQEVTLGKNRPQFLDDNDCELVEHFTKYLLPTIEHQVVDGKAQCGATKHILTGKLKLKVLVPVEETKTISRVDK